MFLFGVSVHYLLVRKVLGGTMHAQIFATFGLMVFLQAAAQFLMGADYFSISGSLLSGVVTVSDIPLPVPHIAAIVGVSLATIALYWLVFQTGPGQSLRAAAQDRQAALTVGINVDRMYAFRHVGVGGACVGVAGSLLSNFYYVFPPRRRRIRTCGLCDRCIWRLRIGCTARSLRAF